MASGTPRAQGFAIWLRSEWDRVAGFTLAAVGGVLVVAGGLAAKAAPTTIDSLSYIATAGLIGLFCLGLGVGLFVSADLHDEWHKLDRIEAAIRGERRTDADDILDLVSRASSADAIPSGLLGTAGDRTGGGRPSGLTATVALNPGAARLLPAILLAPLAVMSLGISQASSSGEFTDSARGVWVAAFAVAATFGLIGINSGRMRARVRRRQAGVLSPYRAVGAARQEAGTGTSSAETGLWVVDGLRHFHRRGCPALAGLEPKPLGRSALGAELVPCGLCGAGG